MSSSPSTDGLKFGEKIYFEDQNVNVVTKASSSSPSGTKKGKGGAVQQRSQPPRCQVEGCKVDLSGSKPYYSRHKVCAIHSKSPTVIVSGLKQRFCQQCSRSQHVCLTSNNIFFCLLWFSVFVPHNGYVLVFFPLPHFALLTFGLSLFLLIFVPFIYFVFHFWPF